MINTTLTEREFLTAFIMYCEQSGYGSAYDQRDCLSSFLARLPQIEQAQKMFLGFKVQLDDTCPEDELQIRDNKGNILSSIKIDC